ncbi:hypothetical protein [Pseudomonas fluorescens]|uniref:hypothetical protein n=1 Tax=Pseudomonas fluorescens TaxID=294 RepID=UPI0005C6FB2D|nr:hypothetical protein [Pseudomonas fluorescens]
MTVSTIDSVAEFDTNGVTTNYPFYFKFLASEDLVVTYISPEGASTVLTLGTHYTVNGAGNDQGGSIVTTSALAGPGQLIVSREMEAFQQTSLRNQGKFLAETHEDVFDKLTMLIQQGYAIFTRALTRPFGRDYFFAENRRIASVKDPVEDQDAATKAWSQRYVGEVIGSVQGPINNAANVLYVYPDGVPRTVQSLATKNNSLLGAAGIGYKNGTVWSDLDKLDTFSSQVIGSSPTLVVPPQSYSGNKSLTVLGEPGSLLSAQTWKAPVHIDLTHLEDPVPPAAGPAFVFGGTGFTSGQYWSQDSYELKGGTFDGGSGEIVSFEPYTGLTAKVEGIRVLNAGSPTSWAVNFKQQNWWPIVSGNTLADYTNKKGNFCKIIDDGGDPDLRYSANSRVIFKDNRCKWLGSEIGGIGFYGSAVGNKLRDNAMEGASIGVILGYPSTFTTIDGLYSEQPHSGQVSVQLGDAVVAPSNIISLVKISDVYCNMHALGTNRIIKPGNNQVVINSLLIDRVFVSSIPTPSPPIIDLNDLPGQKILVGTIEAADMPLIPLLANNYVAISDINRAGINVLNGDFVFADNTTTPVPANTSTAVARNWWAKTAAASSFTRGTNSASGRRSLRQSRQLGIFSISAGSNMVALQIPRANLYESENMTFQVLLNSSSPLSHTLAMRIYNANGTRSTLATRSVTSAASWSEKTVTFYVDPNSLEDSSLLVMELSHIAVGATTLYVTGAGLNRGSFGLCGRRDLDSYDDTVNRMAQFTGIAP